MKLSLPFDAREEPVFSAPWEARVFAAVVQLQAVGHIDWSEFSATLALAVHSPSASDSYYVNWLAAAENLLNQRGLLSSAEIDAAVNRLNASTHALTQGDAHAHAH